MTLKIYEFSKKKQKNLNIQRALETNKHIKQYNFFFLISYVNDFMRKIIMFFMNISCKWCFNIQKNMQQLEKILAKEAI